MYHSFSSVLGKLGNSDYKKYSHSHAKIDTTIVMDLELDTNRIPNAKVNSKRKELTVIATSNINSIRIDGHKEVIDDTNDVDFRIDQINILGKSNLSGSDYRHYTDSNNYKTWIRFQDSFPTAMNGQFRNECDTLSNIFPSPFLLDEKFEETKNYVDKTYALLETKLIDNRLPYSFEVVTDSTTNTKGMRVVYISEGLGFTEWIIDLKGHQLFILKKMVPTILFSLFLLGMICLAFWTLFTNWVKQNRLVAEKNEFINNMTHELKTPIATVGVALEAISNFDLTAEQEKTKEYIDISRNEINRLSLLVDKVLNIAAFDSSASKLKKEAVDIITIIEDIIHSMKLQLEDKSARIILQHDISGSIVVGDKLHLSNVIHNIIDNALKYSTSDPKVDISINENNDSLILSFKDNGQGIPKEYLYKVFDRFFRVPTEDQHDVKGHGLGLNYVQNILHAHGGKITVESIENEGSTFTISLPKSVSNV